MVARWIRPAGFVVVLLLFVLLPNVAVSCSLPDDSAEGTGEITVSATGGDFVVRAVPDVDTSGVLAPIEDNITPDAPLADYLADSAAGPGVQLLAITVLVLLVLGAMTALPRKPRLGAALAIAVAAVVVALMVVIEKVMAAAWRPMVTEAGLFTRGLPDAEGHDMVAEGIDAIRAGLGFWLAIAGLAVVAAVNLVPLVRRRPG